MKRPRSGKNGRKNTTTHLRSSTKNTIPTSPISISAFTVTTAKLWEQLRSKAARGKREPSIKCFRHPCFPFPNPLWKHTHIFHSSPSGLPEKTAGYSRDSLSIFPPRRNQAAKSRRKRRILRLRSRSRGTKHKLQQH